MNCDDAGGRGRRPHPRRILVTVTFNPNQLRAHLEPLLDLGEVDEIVLVTDVPPPSIPRLRAVVPSPALVRLVGRAASKTVVCIVQARRYRPCWVIGFNLVPHGLNAVLAGLAAGTRSMYVMIGGPFEWQDGGWQSDNKLLRRQRRPSRHIEAALLAVARRASLVVTMGAQGEKSLQAEGFAPERLVTIPASVDVHRFHPDDSVEKRWDVVSVAELNPIKRLFDLIDAVARLRADGRTVRLALVGGGAGRAELEERTRRLGVTDSVDFLGFREDTPNILRQALVFALPSRQEGLSIALLEAMATGLPAVVSDVGEARDVVHPGRTGFVHRVGDVAALAHYLSLLLADPELRRKLGSEARSVAVAHASRERIAQAYRAALFGSVGANLTQEP